MTEHIPEQPTDALALARDALEHAAARQRQQRDPAHEQFYDAGREMVGCLAALGELARTVADQVTGYGDHRILRDDDGADPAERLATAAGHLTQFGRALETARAAAEAYWAAIGHIAVEVDPNADPDDEEA